MTELLGQVFAFVLLAFLLGVLVGWLFWRFGRVSVPDEDWGAVRREAEALRAQLDALGRERDAAAAQSVRAAEEVARLHAQLTSAWHDRDLLRLELGRASAALAEARGQLDRTTAQARYLQRRVTELSILRARQGGMPGAPAAPGAPAPPPGPVPLAPGGPRAPLGLPAGRGNGTSSPR